MGGKLYVAGIVLVWGIAMGWLVTERILPPFFKGEPPRSVLAKQSVPVAWAIELDGVPCGMAVLQTVDAGPGGCEVHSHVELDELPWPKATPLWMVPLKNTISSFSIKMHSRLGLDGFERLSDFDTRLWINDVNPPVKLQGRVRHKQLRIKVRASTLTKEFSHAWPADGMLAGELIPESKMLHVYPGKQWQKEVYSPFASPTDPIELLQATVAPEERLHFEDRLLRVRPVEYRSLDRTGLSDKERLRTRLWVAEDGLVLRQESYFLGSRLTFLRLGAEASQLAADSRLDLAQEAADAAIVLHERLE